MQVRDFLQLTVFLAGLARRWFAELQPDPATGLTAEPQLIRNEPGIGDRRSAE